MAVFKKNTRLQLKYTLFASLDFWHGLASISVMVKGEYFVVGGDGSNPKNGIIFLEHLFFSFSFHLIFFFILY